MLELAEQLAGKVCFTRFVQQIIEAKHHLLHALGGVDWAIILVQILAHSGFSGFGLCAIPVCRRREILEG